MPIAASTVPSGRPVPAHVLAVEAALTRVEVEVDLLWRGAGIDGRKVAALLSSQLTGWAFERAGSMQELSWGGAQIQPFRVDAQSEAGRSILEIEGGGALQNNRLHRDLLNTMLLDDVEQLVLVVPYRVHGRSPYEYAIAFTGRLRDKGLLPGHLTVTVFGYSAPEGAESSLASRE